MNGDPAEITAYHEAGHALMAVLVGASVKSITIEPDWDDEPDRFGDTQIEWPVENFTDKELEEKMILVALAGPVAEMLHTGDPYHPGLVVEWAADWEQAVQSVQRLFQAQQKQHAYLEQKSIELYRMMGQEKYWSALAAIVDHLLAFETMERDQIEEVLHAWL